MKTTINKSIIGLVVGAAWILGANMALAGERNGVGDPIPGGDNGRSICSFSGLEDQDHDEDGDFDDPVVPGETQNWGSIPKLIRDLLATMGLHPGDACSPGKPSSSN
jgi:hypothetical protein